MTTPRGPRKNFYSTMDTPLDVDTPGKEDGPKIDYAGLPNEFGRDPMGVVPKGGNKPTGPSGS
jgi:hypothetical protein